jgi:chemotaxis protein CheD
MTLRQTLVRVGRHAVGSAGDLLVAVGLGSCIAVILHDPVSRVGGMAHVLLPDASSATDTSNPFRFAISAVPNLVQSLREAGSTVRSLEARLVGGASMFSSLLSPTAVSMGERNLIASRTALRTVGIPLLGEDVGGEYGRTVRFDIESGVVTVTSVSRAEIVL